MSFWSNKIVLVTGGSAGLGLALGKAFSDADATVVLMARSQQQLDAAADSIGGKNNNIFVIAGDITKPEDVDYVVRKIRKDHGRLDVLVNNAGVSARGNALTTSLEEFQRLWEINFLATVRFTQAAIDLLRESKGHVVNIGSLASKTASPHIGAYPASKFPVAAFSQQIRSELADDGIHVLLVCPGPIRRDDAGSRYDNQAEDLPESAKKPGGGVKLNGLKPEYVAQQTVRACEKRKPELILPGKAKLLFAIQQLWPSLGDWIIKRKTS